ncbi:hypothetical protein HanOQP8_Chr02g0046611 [Helianthus annuus]|nr:hypothetical protein HanOQP8_Chr02g0046611 [Helianthus annuus]
MEDYKSIIDVARSSSIKASENFPLICVWFEDNFYIIFYSDYILLAKNAIAINMLSFT